MAEAVRSVGVDGDVTDDVVTNFEEDRTGIGVTRKAVMELDDSCMEVVAAVDEATRTSDDMGVEVVDGATVNVDEAAVFDAED